MKNSSFFALQKPRITLFYTCQAIRLCESRHDAFACKRAYSQTHHTIPQRPLRSHVQKRKTLPLWGRKTLKGRSCVGGNIKVILFALILYWREIIEYAKGSLRQTHIVP